MICKKLFLLSVLVVEIGCFMVALNDIHAADDYQAKATLKSLNQSIKGDAILVTDMTQPIRFQCDVVVSPEVPSGYVALPIEFQWQVESGQLEGQGNQVSWIDPQPGVQTIRVSGLVQYKSSESGGFFGNRKPEIQVPFQIEQQCVVPRVVDKIENGKIDDFQVGHYPDPLDPNDLKLTSTPDRIRANYQSYLPPKLFYKVNPQNFFLTVFKNYALGEFDLDPRFFELEYPRYVAIQPNILKKLDMLTELMRERGHEVSKFKFIYAFRCPHYNLSARGRDGDETLKSPFSIHMYGGALDMIVDEDNDLIMDDLNGDGKIDRDDAYVLFQAVYDLDKRLLAEGSDLIGGRGLYYHHDYYERGEVAQTPYVHMDVRGFTREDGSLIYWKDPDKIGVLEEDNPYRLKQPIPPYPWEN